MAITWGGTAATAIVSTGSATSLTIAKPSGLANNDVLVAVVATENALSQAFTSWTLPSGWVQISGANNDSITTGTHMAHFYKVVATASSEPADYTFQFTATGGANGDMAGIIAVATGVDNTTPIDVVAGALGNATSSTITFPAITTVTNGAHVVGGGGQARNGTITYNDSQTKLASVSSANATAASRATAYLGYIEQATAGAAGTRTATSSQSRPYYAAAFALRPSTGSAPNQGTASGTWTFAGSAVGESTRQGTATGSWTFTGAAVGSNTSDPAVVTAPAATATAAGVSPTIEGGVVVADGGPATATAMAHPPVVQAGTPASNTGTATGSWSFAGAAAGSRPAGGTAAGTWTFTGAATGASSPEGNASGTWTFTGAAVGLSPSTITTTFPGSTLPAGWSEYDPADHGTVTVSGGHARLNHGSTARDSISSVGSTDASIGIQHALDGGDLDIAVRVDGTDTGDHGDQLSHSVNLLAIGASTASMVRMSLYQAGTDAERIQFYGYTRTGGAGGTMPGSGLKYDVHFGGVPNWWRMRYTASTGLWEFLTSGDGATWTNKRNYPSDSATTDTEATRQFTPATFVVSLSNSGTSSAARAVPVRIGRVVDLLEHGSEDVREEVPARTTTVLTTMNGAAGELPPGWQVQLVGDAFTSSWTGTALRLTSTNATESPNLTGIHAALRYAGTSRTDWQMYLAASNPTANANFYFVPGIMADPVGTEGLTADGGLDEYSWGGGYGLEVQSGAIRRPIRVDDDSDRTHGPTAPFPTGLDETPYHHFSLFTGQPTFATGTHHFLFQRIGGRYRVKEWTGVRGDEPAEWNLFDGDDFVNVFDMRPYLSWSYNNNGGTASVDIHTVEWAALAEGESLPTGVASGTWSFTGAAAGSTDMAGTATGTWGFAGAAAGSTSKEGTAGGSWGFAGAAVGATTREGTAGGSWGFVGVAVGGTVTTGTATGTWTFTGVAVGITPPILSPGTPLPGYATLTARPAGVAVLVAVEGVAALATRAEAVAATTPAAEGISTTSDTAEGASVIMNTTATAELHPRDGLAVLTVEGT